MPEDQQPQPMPQQEPVAPMPMQQQTGVYGAPQAPMAMNQQGHGMAIASMVLGIISIVLCWLWFIAIPLGILAIVFGVICHKKHVGGGTAMAGLVTGIIGTVLAIIIIVLAVLAVNKASNDLNDTFKRLDNQNNSFKIQRN